MTDDRGSGEDRRWAVVPRVHSGLDGAYEMDLSLESATRVLRQAQRSVPELEWVLVTHEEAMREKPAPGQEPGFVAAEPEPRSRS